MMRISSTNTNGNIKEPALLKNNDEFDIEF